MNSRNLRTILIRSGVSSYFSNLSPPTIKANNFETVYY